MELKAGYLVNERVWERKNKAGQNYWWIYIEEILNRLGLTAERILPEEMPRRLEEFSLLFIGDEQAGESAARLQQWVESGGMLIGSNTEGLDGLFGNELAARLPQKESVFSISGEFFLGQSPFTRGVHSPLHPDKPLLAVSPLRLVRTLDSAAVACRGESAVITARACGKGWAFYFGLDLAQTCWVFHQGRPVDRDYDGDGMWRTIDGIILGDREYEIGYSDELLFLLRKMVALASIPLIHYLPATPDGQVPDVLFYYAGDDDAMAGVSVPASQFMKEKGLPYHINIMPGSNGQFVVTPEEAKTLEKNGTEISLHFNFIDGFTPAGRFTRQDVERQTVFFRNVFGKQPVCSVTHCGAWTGWHEPALWMRESGLIADNSKMIRRCPPVNPVNELGLSFGTALPYCYRADHTGGNERIEFVELPIVSYECGYLKEQSDFPKLEKVLTLATHYNLAINIFYHPVYIAQYPACRKAITRLLEMIQERNLRVIHSTPDEFSRWWLDRGRSSVSQITREGNKMSFDVVCNAPQGCIVQLPAHGRRIKTSLPHQIREHLAEQWFFLPLPPGEHAVQVEFES